MPRPTASVPPVRFNVGGAAMPRPIHNARQLHHSDMPIERPAEAGVI